MLVDLLETVCLKIQLWMEKGIKRSLKIANSHFSFQLVFCYNVFFLSSHFIMMTLIRQPAENLELE